MKKGIDYETLGWALKTLSDACFEAARQKKGNEPVTACGMTDEDIEELCQTIPYMMNPMMSTEEVKEKLCVSDSTLNRMVKRGDIPNGKSRRHGHTRYWFKWDIFRYLKNKRKK